MKQSSQQKGHLRARIFRVRPTSWKVQQRGTAVYDNGELRGVDHGSGVVCEKLGP